MTKKLLKKQKEWVELLKTQIRPGTKRTKILQKTGSLTDGGDKAFCCLGVCERFVMGKSFDSIREELFLSKPTIEKLKFKNKEGKFKKPNPKELTIIENHNYAIADLIKKASKPSDLSLAKLNDEGISFESIAWFIEKFPHLVFK